ncbi:MAG: trigger factor, partial [Candidatus Competibacteraceae bacterium]|nr:trigger factor [Candidatus Competibacteraceae bacterium]
ADNELKIDEDRVRERLENVAASYQDSSEVIRYYRQNPRLMQGIHDLVMEDQIVDWLLESAVFEEQTMSFEEVMNPKRPAASGTGNIEQDSGEDDTPNEQ